jgi:peptidoglycan/xylan/chitin deacetylase (PgdA/CDA1 family)
MMPAMPPATVRRAAGLLVALAVAGACLGPTTVAAASPAVPVTHGSRTSPGVALTFDDGWTGAGALRLARVFAAAGAHATFFPYGAAVWQSPAIFSWIAGQPGFEIANHTATHDVLCYVRSTGCIATSADPATQITGGRTVVEGLTGRPMLDVLRTPGGGYDNAALSAAGAAGFSRVVGWDTSAADTVALTAAGVRKNMDKALDGSIVLAHMGSVTTMAALPDVIADLRAAAHTLVTVSELLGLPAEPPQATQDYATGGFGPAGGAGPRWQPSEALDAAGHRYLAWTAPDGVWFASDRTGAWVAERVAASITGVEYYEQPSIALSGDGTLGIAMTHETETGTTVVVALRAGFGWALVPVPGQGGFASIPSLAVGRSGVFIAYRVQGRWDITTAPGRWAGQGLYLASLAGGSWHTELVSMEASDMNPSLALDPGTGRPVVAFRARTGVNGLDPRGTWLAVRGATGWGYTQASPREAYPSLRIRGDGTRDLLLSDATSTALVAGSGAPGAAFTWRTIGAGLQGSLGAPGVAVATAVAGGRAALEEIAF